MLLEHGARGDKKDSWGVTVLEHPLTPIMEGIAAVHSPGNTKLKIPELLLKQGADPNQRLTKVSGEPTLLIYALDRELWELAAMALRHGANANLVDKNGHTPLVQAVQKGHVDAVALLIQHGPNVNQPQQTVPLDVAIAMKKPEIIELLKAHGAVSVNNTMGNGDGINISLSGTRVGPMKSNASQVPPSS